MAIWSRLFSGVFGVGVGIAAADAVQPVVEVARQDAWKANANRVLEPGSLAALLAQGLVDASTATDHAARNGYDADKLDALAQLAMRAPGIADVRELTNREKIPLELLHHAYAKAQIEPQYWTELDDLLHEHLSPEVVALAIVRGLIDDPGILPVPPPTTPGKVKQFPRFAVDALKESKSQGVDRERLSVLVGISGRPMAPEAAALAVFKGIIERADYDRAVGEGDVRNEWAEAIFENARFVLSPPDAAGLYLRGWIDVETMNAIGALHGATPETMNRLYLNRGRPAAPAQMATAAVRGIDGPDGRPMDEEQFLKGIRESDIRPEWGPMLWESRFLYPSLFQLTRLVTSGAVPVETAVEWARKARYAPEVVAALEKSWSGTGSTASTPWATRAQGRLYTTAHAEYMTYTLDEAGATAVLERVGVSGDELALVIALWNAERAIDRRLLTPAQIKKAYRDSLFTETEALSRLGEQGYSPEDARTLLTE